MKRLLASSLLLAALLSLFLGGCVLVTQDSFQSVLLHVRLTEEIPAEQRMDIHTAFYPAAIVLKGNFLRLSGAVGLPAGAKMPPRATLQIVSEDAAGQVYDRFALIVPIEPDGSFSAAKKLKKSIRPLTLQTFRIQTETYGVPVGTAPRLLTNRGESSTKFTPSDSN